MTAYDKLARCRALMKSEGIDLLIIPSSDPHMSEYLPERWKMMAWLTGFTGSAGTVVITGRFAGVWTDSRYFIQAEEELRDSGFELVRLKMPHTPEFLEWIGEHTEPGHIIGYDGSVVSVALGDKIRLLAREKELSVRDVSGFFDKLWPERPQNPCTPVFVLDDRFTGKSANRKLATLRRRLKEKNADVFLVSALDEIAWLLNIRASDIPYNPVTIAHAMISDTEALLFIEKESIGVAVREYLERLNVHLYPYESWWEHLASLPPGQSVWYDPSKASDRTFTVLNNGRKLIDDPSPVQYAKAIKNQTELRHLKETMIRDGVALEKFYFWLENNIGKIRITEMSAAEKIHSFREQQDDYQGPSFAPISGFGPHGAVIHYSPKPETDVLLEEGGIYLLDSGGQYFSGTTDVTRTIALGNPTKAQKRDYTLVLKGVIALSSIRFPEGTRGDQLDILARKALWEAGMNYGHGTGHGVGFFLNVHEGPQSIGTGATAKGTPLEPGMVLTNEPGLYREGEYGIRTENMMYCKKDRDTEFGKFLAFETLTLCHLDSRLIDPGLLTDAELVWLNNYHKRVYQALSKLLTPAEQKWLNAKTQAIKRKAD